MSCVLHLTPSFLALQHFPRVLTRNASVFVIEASTPSLPAELISLLRLLLMPQPEWAKTKMKEKPPKANLDAELIPVVIKMLVIRLEMYETTLEV
jgi:N-lysine methyltransferase SETD6